MRGWREAAAVLSAACACGAVGTPVASAATVPSGRTTYRVLADFERDAAALAAARPTLVRRLELGTSVEGRPLWALELGARVARTDDGRPTLVVVGLQHAREWPSGEVALEWARDLASRFGQDQVVTRLLRRLRIVVVPVANPDGFVVSRGEDPSAPAGAQPGRRTSCAVVRPLDGLVGCPARGGVDLNRNFGFAWGGPGASPTPGDEDFRGSRPFSEPETRALHALSAGRQVTGVVALHSVGGLVLRQPGTRAYGLGLDDPRGRDLAAAMSAATGYPAFAAVDLYEVHGALEDWNAAEQDAAVATVELGPVGSRDFHGSYGTAVAEQYAGTLGRTGVRGALLAAAAVAADPRHHGVLTGRGPAGARLEASRTFTTRTAAVCADRGCLAPGRAEELPGGIRTSLGVGASGRFSWHVGASTRPAVLAAGGREAWTVTCVARDGRRLGRVRVVVGRGQAVRVAPCGVPRR